jgi:signal transduction histidine kinase
MDARPDPAHPTPRPCGGGAIVAPAPDRGPLHHGELRVVLAELSHELCRPLTSLRAGFALLLGDASRPVSSEHRGHLQTMVGLCDDLLALTRGYLDYAALVQGARPLRLGSYTLGALIGEIDRQFAPAAADRRIDWQCSGDAAAVIITDASRCQQIVGNLVANALKYTPEALPHVFEPFYRLPRDERRGIEGNGLGLAICRELVEQLGGQITIGREPAEGTRATVRLPVSTPGCPKAEDPDS